MSEQSNLETAAERLQRAYDSRTLCAPVRDLIDPADFAAGRAVQQINLRIWTQQGRRPMGRKVALSSKAVQQQMGVHEPTYGTLFADMCWAEGVEIPFAELTQPKLETEVAVVLGQPLPHAHNTVADVMSAIAYAVPALEVVGCRIANWDVTAAEFIADNAAGSLFVLGSQPRSLSDFDIVRCRMTTWRHGEKVSDGVGAASYGNPLHALVWLANSLSQSGQPLQAGDVIMTGSLGPMIPIQPGDAFEAEIEGLGKVGCSFSA